MIRRGRTPRRSDLPAERLLGGWHAVGRAIAAATTGAARAPTAAAGPAPATTATRRPRVRHVDGQLAAVQVLAVELRDGPLRLLGRGHLHEPEAPGLPGELVGDHRRRLDRAALGEVLAEGFARGRVREPTNVE